MLGIGLPSGEAPAAPHAWLREFDYRDSLIQPDWSLRRIDDGKTDLTIPYMAFWNQPFDVFHTALAVVYQNGVPAPDIAARTASHVLLCTQKNTVELWLFDEQKGVRPAQSVERQHVRTLIAKFKERLRPKVVAKEKIRWRQYALYEADPNGNAFQGWSVQPSIAETDQTLKKMIRDVVPIPNNTNVPIDEGANLLRDRARWLFRLLSLRVGKDRGWGIASHLARGDATDFAEHAMLYPVQWQPDASLLGISERTGISESVLSRLENFNFSTVDPLFIAKAVSARPLKGLRLETDLFPTPRPFAWDMMDTIPLHHGMCVCDPTVGTGTFLIAAGHALWDRANIGDGELPDLGEVLRGGDRSEFSVDLARIALDLAFGWRDAGWNVSVADAGRTLEEMPIDRQWALVGNLPWAAKGKARNAAALVLERYVSAFSNRDAGWIGVITPRSVWTSVKQKDVHLRERIAKALQLESSWELPWATIVGGRAQAVATVLSKGQPQTTTIWKQVDGRGMVHTVGYSQPNGRSDDCLSAPARFLRERLADFDTLREVFDVWEGVKFKGKGELVGIPRGGTVPVIRRKREVGVDNARPQKLSMNDIIKEGGWVHRNSRRPAKQYAAGLLKFPQLVIPRHIYEGTSRGILSLCVTGPLLFSDAFLISVPKRDYTLEFVRGIGALFNTAIGRLWMHVFATVGRDLSNQSVMDFPLPQSGKVEELGRRVAQTTSPHIIGSSHYEVLHPSSTFDADLEVCRAYGFKDHESAAVLGLSNLMGIRDRIPRTWLDGLDGVLPDAVKMDRLEKEAVMLAERGGDLSGLYLEILSEQRKLERIVAGGKACGVAIKKASVSADDLGSMR